MIPIELTKEYFLRNVADYINSPTEWNYLGDKPAFIGFYAPWCKSCKKRITIFNELAGEYAGQIYVYKVDTEKNEELAEVFGIRSLPASLFLPMKGDPQVAQGFVSKAVLAKVIDKLLLNK